jgi:hypothetical protein
VPPMQHHKPKSSPENEAPHFRTVCDTSQQAQAQAHTHTHKRNTHSLVHQQGIQAAR